MRDDVPCSEVLKFLEKHGYQLLSGANTRTRTTRAWQFLGGKTVPISGLRFETGVFPMISTTKSSKSSKAAKPKAPDVDAPLGTAILKQAQRIAAGYRYIIRPRDRSGYIGSSIELPLVMASGKTPEECLRRAVFGAETAIATMLERGESPPSSAYRRSEQINIRLTSEEKLLLEEESQRQGYRGLSDFVRAAALAKTGEGR